MAKPRATMRKAFAYTLFFFAFLFTLAWMGGGYDAGMWLFSALVFGGVGWAILRGTRRDAEENEGAEKVHRQLAVLKLAEAEDGQLTVTEVAARLGWTLDVAQETMRSLEDGKRVTTTITDDGIMLYDFPELIHDPGRRTRLP